MRIFLEPKLLKLVDFSVRAYMLTLFIQGGGRSFKQWLQTYNESVWGEPFKNRVNFHKAINVLIKKGHLKRLEDKSLMLSETAGLLAKRAIKYSILCKQSLDFEEGCHL